MKTHKLNERGYAHYVAVGVVVMLVAVGGVFTLVLKAHQSVAPKNAQSVAPNAKTTGQISDSTKTQSTASTVSNPSVVATTPPTASNSSPSAKKSTTSTKSSSSGSSSKPTSSSPTPAPAPTPLSVLTNLVVSLNNGGAANVTASNVSVPAAVSGNVNARPIVFSVSGTTYFAYTRVNPPDFNTSASTTANSMAIVQASGSYSLVQAHVGKTGYLTDPNSEYVGYTPSSN